MLSYHATGEAGRTAENSVLWANLTRPILSDNMAKWRHDTLHHVQQFECGARDTLAHLGYDVACLALPHPDARELERIQGEDRRLRAEVLGRVGADGGNRDAQGLFLADLGKARANA
jgi:hypothetical protein